MVGNYNVFDTVLELCRDRQRRIVLAVLADQRRSLTVNDLAKTVVKHNHHVPLSEITEAEATRIHLSLHHVHIPKLEACSLVEYDLDRQLIEPTAEFDRLQPHLSAIVDADPDLDAPVEL